MGGGKEKGEEKEEKTKSTGGGEEKKNLGRKNHMTSDEREELLVQIDVNASA